MTMMTSCECKAPWDNVNADVVLRSSDAQCFKADKLFLVRAFQTFEDMFVSRAIPTVRAITDVP